MHYLPKLTTIMTYALSMTYTGCYQNTEAQSQNYKIPFKDR
jgi:hypothetical protein